MQVNLISKEEDHAGLVKHARESRRLVGGFSDAHALARLDQLRVADLLLPFRPQLHLERLHVHQPYQLPRLPKRNCIAPSSRTPPPPSPPFLPPIPAPPKLKSVENATAGLVQNEQPQSSFGSRHAQTSENDLGVALAADAVVCLSNANDDRHILLPENTYLSLSTSVFDEFGSGRIGFLMGDRGFGIRHEIIELEGTRHQICRQRGLVARYAIVEELAAFGATVHTCSCNQKELDERRRTKSYLPHAWDIGGQNCLGGHMLESSKRRENLSIPGKVATNTSSSYNISNKASQVSMSSMSRQIVTQAIRLFGLVRNQSYASFVATSAMPRKLVVASAK
ncbi:hypothetical protein RJ640_000259 [Escallonia rubra]|uniref:Uncharacterized protein n=1 Tax=Escallonia rubra TaxID=112253 RepID=A0AA88UQV1_9ASTE|nr:hypothetical protein RJ640_000259 [Escallonia rubra]